MFAVVDLFYLAVGGALVWFYKDEFLAWTKGAEAFAAKLKADAEAIEAKAAAIKAAAIKAAVKS